MTTTPSRSRFSIPPPRPLAWALALLCWFGYAILDFGPQVQTIIKIYPDSSWWGFDADLVLQASKRLLDGGAIYSDSRMLYAPLAVVFGIPAALVPREYALLIYALLKVALAVGVTYWLTRGSWLAVLAILTFLPFINDVAPGNFMVPITAAMAVSTFGRPARRSGIALGLVAAAIPKPLLVPYFVWLLAHRRRAFEGAVAAGFIASALAALVTGPAAYLDWLHNLVNGTGYISGWEGNYGVSAYLPSLAVPVAVVVMALTLLVVVRVDENRSLAWVLAAGILVSPYAGPLTALPLVLALPLMRPWPRLYAVALLQPLSTISAALVGIVALLAGPPGMNTASGRPGRRGIERYGADPRGWLARVNSEPAADAPGPTNGDQR
ncbi:MAG: glycosyltransferase family 87 protein [Candidatus Limnocylindrales bacterium]